MENKRKVLELTEQDRADLVKIVGKIAWGQIA